MSWPLDQPIRLTFLTYSDAARQTLADATTITLDILKPDGTTTTVTPTHGVTGTYYYDYTPAVAGHYSYHWHSTGTVTSAADGAFDVLAKYDVGLVDLATVKIALNITGTTDDDELQDTLDRASALLVNHPDYRISDIVSAQTYTEWSDAGNDAVILKHYPVSAVTSVTEYAGGSAQVLVAEPRDGGMFTGYGWDYADGSGADGILVRLSNGTQTTWQGNRVKVVYTAGTGAVPADLRGAALDLVTHLWETQRGGSGPGFTPGLDLSESAGTFGQAYGPTYALPNRVREQLEPYRKAPAVA